MYSKVNSKTPMFTAEKGFLHKAAKHGDGRTSLRFTSPKARGLRYLLVKSIGSEIWGR